MEKHSLDEVQVDKESLLQKGWSAAELVGKKITILGPVMAQSGDMGPFISTFISFDGGETKDARPFQTGAQNIRIKLLAADDQGLLPLEVTVTKHGNAFDIK